jgi:hypothetical protein
LQDRDSVLYLWRQKTYIGAAKNVGGLKVYADSLIRVTSAGFTAG